MLKVSNKHEIDVKERKKSFVETRKKVLRRFGKSKKKLKGFKNL